MINDFFSHSTQNYFHYLHIYLRTIFQTIHVEILNLYELKLLKVGVKGYFSIRVMSPFIRHSCQKIFHENMYYLMPHKILIKLLK